MKEATRKTACGPGRPPSCASPSALPLTWGSGSARRWCRPRCSGARGAACRPCGPASISNAASSVSVGLPVDQAAAFHVVLEHDEVVAELALEFLRRRTALDLLHAEDHRGPAVAPWARSPRARSVPRPHTRDRHRRGGPGPVWAHWMKRAHVDRTRAGSAATSICCWMVAMLPPILTRSLAWRCSCSVPACRGGGIRRRRSGIGPAARPRELGGVRVSAARDVRSYEPGVWRASAEATVE